MQYSQEMSSQVSQGELEFTRSHLHVLGVHFGGVIADIQKQHATYCKLRKILKNRNKTI